MDIYEKISNSRIVLKELLNNEWNTDEVPILSVNEIKDIYNYDTSKNNILNILGIASKCSFTVNHKIINSHKLHVLYYNFPEDGINSSRITKSILNKIKQLYEKHIDYTDNILFIINEQFSEPLVNISNMIAIDNQSRMFANKEVYDTILAKFSKKSIELNTNHFGNVHFLSINSVVKNILESIYVPKHKVIRDKNEIESITEACNCKIHQLPVIDKYDIMSMIHLLVPGDICEITRISKKVGEYKYYRLCR